MKEVLIKYFPSETLFFLTVLTVKKNNKKKEMIQS